MEEVLQSKSSFKSQLKPCLSGCWVATILCPLFMLGEVLLEVLIPSMMGRMINEVENMLAVGTEVTTVLEEIGQTSLIMIGMSVVSLACGIMGAYLSAYGGTLFARNLRRSVFYRIQSFSFYNIDRFQTSSLVTRCTTDITNMQNMYMMLVRICFRAPAMLVFATIMAFVMGGSLALVFVVVLPVLAVALFTIMGKAHPRFAKMLKKYDGLNENVQENLTNIRVVKSFVREEDEKNKFKATVTDVMKAQLSAEMLIVFVMPLMQVVMSATKVAVLGFGGSMIFAGSSLQVGSLSSMLTYTVQILSSLMMLGMITVNLTMSRASAVRLDEVFKEEPSIVGAESDDVVENGSIEFSNVSFSYKTDSDNYVLKDVSLKIKSGQTVGIIGGTGEGKSSLVQLIPRLYDASKGAVKVGGKDVREYRLKNLRDSVAMVLQKNVLFSGSIRENLKWGNPAASDEEIVEACKKAQAHDFVMSFPDGYDTDLGQGGVNVSGGQKQRLCIARALLKNPKVIILDDSTSAVDTATDEKIRNEFAQSLPSVTKIIIAQRIASVEDSDMIVVIDEGKIDDVGTHKELIERCKIYREVYQSQNKEVAHNG